MAYKTRPYTLKGLAPDLSREFEIAHGKITTYGQVLGGFPRVLGTHIIKPTTSTSARDSNILGYGNVTVSTDGTIDTYERLRNVQAFMRAVEKEKESQQTATISEQELEDFRIVIPPLPEGISMFIYNTKYSRPSYRISDGKWVQAGDILAELSPQNDYFDSNNVFGFRSLSAGLIGRNTTNIIAPVSGKLVFSYSEKSIDCDWSRETGKPEIQFGYFEPYFVKIRPVKEAAIQNSTYKAFKPIIDWCEEFISDSDRLRRFENVTGEDLEQVKWELEALKSHQSPKVPLTDPDYAELQRQSENKPDNDTFS